MDELDLIRRCKARDTGVWSFFVDKYSALVWWAIKDRLIKAGFSFCEEDAEDIYQDVMAGIWAKNKLAEVGPPYDLVNWLIKVSGNAAVGYLQSSHGKRRAAGPEGLEDIADHRHGPREALIQDEFAQVLGSILDTLDETQRLMLILAYVEEKTHQEIAEQLSLSRDAVSSAIRRAKERLREECERRNITFF